MHLVSHVLEVGTDKAFCLTGPRASSGKAIRLSGPGKAFGLVGGPVGFMDGPVGSMDWLIHELPTRCEMQAEYVVHVDIVGGYCGVVGSWLSFWCCGCGCVCGC